MEITQSNSVDIAIIGGGVAGCTAAIALSNSYNVALIDKLSEPVERVGECLAPAARRIFKQLGLLDEFEKKINEIHQRNNGMQSYWGSKNVQIVDPLRNPDGFGWQLNRKEFESFLRKKAVERSPNCFWSYQLFQCKFENEHWVLTFASTNEISKKKVIRAKFVIDASGRQSHFAKKIGVERQSVDKLISIWATLTNEEISTLSTISASQSGWWYTAPLPNKKRIMAFQTDSDLIEHAQLKTKEAFINLALCNEQMKTILEKSKNSIQFNGIVAANSTQLKQVTGQQWAALGDAAISFDPLSSQGMFNAMANALQLTDLLTEHQIIFQPNSEKTNQFQREYSEQVNQIWKHYLHHKRIFYSQELRWSNSEFWKRRR
ncbi:NAD(P)/FAD-dependent oxidoreductase [Flavobacterium sp.]|uniref:NAD(P)/FAD-dependent oxidoreductase n=1 Tax=Flavobacterium sp. TaxID=239 RepID=UPI002B4B828C|nr:NAD(P)/FAD-dependent oxidoreductase [Flavobacterium sp.]HLP65212.1 NAD(P)/FAD-dependent oxidoreductase [Flavobacterium sp.]